MKLKVHLNLRKYICDPYWPEREQVVNIQKQSGTNRAKSEDKKDQALRKYLDKIGMSYEQYQDLIVQASRPWYKDNAGNIYIPRHHLSGCLVQGCKTAPAGARFDADQLRCLVQISDFVTNKQKCDTIFSRFVLPTDGKGNMISNQRRLTKNEVIENTEATGVLEFDPTDVKQKSLLDLLNYCGKYVGVGASRKMGYGRFGVAGAKEV